MLTLAVLFPVYFLAEKISGQGGGTMATFTFGLVLANYRYFTKRLGADLRLDRHLISEFNSEVSFFLKSYYFVYIGLIVTLARRYMLVGLVVTILSLVVRYIVGTGVGRLLKFSKEELVISRLIFPLGTSALVMSQLPIIFDPQGAAFVNPEIYPNLVFPVVLGTVIFTAIAGLTLTRRQLT